MLNYKKIISFLGKTIGYIILAYILYKFFNEYGLSDFIDRINRLGVVSFFVLFLNFIALLSGIYIWHILLANNTNLRIKYLDSFAYFVKTEVGKYLPGNVFHFVGRQLIASRLGISQKVMFKITFSLSVLLVIGTFFAGTMFGLLSTKPFSYIMLLIYAGLIGSVLYNCIFLKNIKRFTKIKINFFATLSLGINGLMMGIVIFTQLPEFHLKMFFEVACLYVVSWFLGFIVPGASGGLGVREGAFLMLAKLNGTFIPESVIIFSVVTLRIFNIVTDIAAFLLSYYVKRTV